MSTIAKYIEKEFLSPDELVAQTTKTRTLNLMSNELDTLSGLTDDLIIISLIEGLREIIADAYVISMYKFQFKIFSSALDEEINAIKKMVEYE